MTDIITPLDNIIDIINELSSANQTNRRGSNLDNAYSKILSNINLAKNNVIKHLFDEKPQNNQKLSYAQCTKTKPVSNIVIPISDKKLDTKEMCSVEQRVNNILKSSDTYVVKSTATQNGNVILKVNNNDELENLSENLKTEFGQNVKIQTPFSPKIKLSSIPSYFNTTDKESIVQRIVEKNSFLSNEYNANHDSIQYLFTYNTNSGKTIVLKCSPKVRNLIKQQNDSLIIDCFKCKIYDHFHILQCSKCCKYGHSSKNCKSN